MRVTQITAIAACLGLIAIFAFSFETKPPKEKTAMSKETIKARIVGPDGSLSEPREIPKIQVSDEEWQKKLSPEEYRILRQKGTERAFTGDLLKSKGQGIYTCSGCGLPLFDSDTKFESGTGWPSYYQPISPGNMLEHSDQSHGMVRTEVLCPRCEGHLGHVFDDGPQPTGLRYCINSESLDFVARDDLKSITEPVQTSEKAEVVLAGGCFWCVEGVFEQVDGILDAESGYTGGDAATANYKDVCSGQTKHAEAVRIVYDPNKVSLDKIYEIHFATHDPTTLNRQGNDAGPQYRSAIFYANEEEKKKAEAFIAHLEEEKKFPGPIVTTLEPLETFYPAEAYHQDYVSCNPGNPYVRAVAMPKVEKVRSKFQDSIRDFLTAPAGE